MERDSLVDYVYYLWSGLCQPNVVMKLTDNGTRRLTLVFSTGSTGNEDRQARASLGATHFLPARATHRSVDTVREGSVSRTPSAPVH